jgi:hypothetical protein
VSVTVGSWLPATRPFSRLAPWNGSSGTPYVRGAISRLLTSHEPYPVLVKDRYRNVIDRNRNGDAHTGRREVMEPRANSLRMALRDRLLKKYRRRPPVNQHPCS